MPDEKRDDAVDDEMPEERRPCGDIFGQPEVTYATDADADIIGEDATD